MGKRNPLPEQNIPEMEAMKKPHTKHSPNQKKEGGSGEKAAKPSAEGNRKKHLKRNL